MSTEGRLYVERNSPYVGTTYHVHLRIGILANKDHGYEVWCGDRYIADLCRCSPKAVQRARVELTANGFIDLVYPAYGKNPPRYRFLFPQGGQGDRSQCLGGQGVPKGWTSRPFTPIYTTEYKRSEIALSVPVDMAVIRARRQKIMPSILDRTADSV